MSDMSNQNPLKLADDAIGASQPSREEISDKPISAQDQPPQGRQPDSKGKSVFLYLAILFASAFAMLLLAYFVQQRNNETAMGNLHSIDSLVENNQALRERSEELERQLEEQSAQMTQAAEDNLSLLRELQLQLTNWSQFWTLEQCYQAQHYESCAALFVKYYATASTHYTTPKEAVAQEQRILQDLLDRGYLAEDYLEHPDDYQELVDAWAPHQH